MSGGHTQPDVVGAPRRIIRLEQTDSTNRYLKQHSDTLPDRTVCYTDCQQAGRGRRGHEWETPPHTSLALSLLLFPEDDARSLPLICAVAAARAIERAAELPAYIKWPNDIVCSDRKVCGILCESGMCDDRFYAVAGLGINLTQTAQDMQAAGLPHAASLSMLTGKAVPPDDMAALLTAELDAALAQLFRAGLAEMVFFCSSVDAAAIYKADFILSAILTFHNAFLHKLYINFFLTVLRALLQAFKPEGSAPVAGYPPGRRPGSPGAPGSGPYRPRR